MKKKKLQKIFLKHQTVLLNPLFENQIITKKRLKNCQITLKEVYFQLIKDYAKNHEFPQNNVKFYKYGRVLYFLIIQLLGRGAFGKVNLGLHILSGRLIAIKSFNKLSLSSENSKKKIYYESNLMKNLRHNSIVRQ